MYDLDRFVAAQEAIYQIVLEELRRGRKETHWIWFIFPQIAGLGSSSTSQLYALTSLAEARAYLAHSVLGARLRECCAWVLAAGARSPEEMLGPLDAQKLHSCATLFHRAAPDDPLFAEILVRHYRGVPDTATDLHLVG